MTTSRPLSSAPTLEQKIDTRLDAAAGGKDEMVAMAPSKAAGFIHLALVSTVRAAREGLRVLLERDPAIVVGFQGDASPDSITSLSNAAPDAVLADGSCWQCLEALPHIRARLPATPLVVYAVQPIPEVLLSCARNGATVIASRDAGPQTLTAMVKNVTSGRLGGEARLNATLLEELGLRADATPSAMTMPLTRREREIALALAEGLTNKEIAGRFYITLSTVKSHVHCILRKLDVGSRSQVLSRLRGSAA